MKATLTFAMVLVGLTLSGCGDASPPVNQAQKPPTGAPPPPPAAAPKAPDPSAPSANPPAPTGGAAPAQPQDDLSREKAEAGVGEKGHYKEGASFVATPIDTGFRIRERTVFEMQIPKAMDLYKAQHNNKGPKTNAEYMRYIIEDNSIQLPELPAGDSYIYDPAREELMVQHPRK